MLRTTFLKVLLCACLFMPFQAFSSQIFINELHYDNTGGDVGEFVEIAGSTGTSLNGWKLYFYNGSNGRFYNDFSLSGIFSDLNNGFGFLSFAFSGIQNGAPDGLALVNDLGSVIEFISYEGELTAADGPAGGLTSLDIGVEEGSTTPVGYSLFRTGTGRTKTDFSWVAGIATSGLLNNGQQFVSSRQVNNVNEPGILALLIPLILWLINKPGLPVKLQSV